MAATIVLVAAACGDDNNDSSSGSGATTTTAAGANVDYKSLTGTLNGSGSTFQDTFEQKAKTEFKTVAAGRDGELHEVGLVGRQERPRQHRSCSSPAPTARSRTPTAADVQGRHGPLLPDRRARRSPCRTTSTGVDDAAAAAPTRSPASSSGTITTWNDPTIKADNPDATLPSTPIVVVHRSDGSGTTQQLHQVPDEGRARPRGRSTPVTPSNWPDEHPGRREEQRRRPRSSSRPTARSATSTSPTPRPPTSSTPPSRTRPASSSSPTLDGAGRRARRARRSTPTSPTTRSTPRAPTPTRSRRRPGSSCTPKQPDPKAADALKGYLNFMLTEGQDARRQSVGLRHAAVATGQDKADRPAATRSRPDRPRRDRTTMPVERPRIHDASDDAVGTEAHAAGPTRSSGGLALAAGLLVLVILAAHRLVDDPEGLADVPRRGRRATSPRREWDRRARASSGSWRSSTARWSSSAIALVFAVPVSLGIALFITEVAPRRLRSSVITRDRPARRRCRRWCSACGASSSCAPTPQGRLQLDRRRVRTASRCSRRSSGRALSRPELHDRRAHRRRS